MHGKNECTSNFDHERKDHTKSSIPKSVTDPLCLVPSQFLPVYLLVSFQSHPIELPLDKARCLCEQHFHQIFPIGSDDSRKKINETLVQSHATLQTINLELTFKQPSQS